LSFVYFLKKLTFFCTPGAGVPVCIVSYFDECILLFLLFIDDIAEFLIVFDVFLYLDVLPSSLNLLASIDFFLSLSGLYYGDFP